MQQSLHFLSDIVSLRWALICKKFPVILFFLSWFDFRALFSFVFADSAKMTQVTPISCSVSLEDEAGIPTASAPSEEWSCLCLSHGFNCSFCGNEACFEAKGLRYLLCSQNEVWWQTVRDSFHLFQWILISSSVVLSRSGLHWIAIWCPLVISYNSIISHLVSTSFTLLWNDSSGIIEFQNCVFDQKICRVPFSTISRFQISNYIVGTRLVWTCSQNSKSATNQAFRCSFAALHDSIGFALHLSFPLFHSRTFLPEAFF